MVKQRFVAQKIEWQGLRRRQQTKVPPLVLVLSNSILFLLFSIIILASTTTTTNNFSCHAFSVSSSNNNSPWKSASWKLILNIGREPSSNDNNNNDFNSPEGEEWGKSGARLSFPIEILVESERLSDQQQDPLLGPGRGVNRLRIVNEDKTLTYITTEKGEQRVPINKTGGWKLSRLGNKKGHASLLRFWIDLGSNSNNSNDDIVVAQKQDVTLRANDRLYFAAHCWRETDWEIGRRQIQPLVEAYEKAQEKLVNTVNHEGGDRRLDGTDAFETLAAYTDMAGLTLDRDDKRRQLLDAQEYLPPPTDLSLGNWPGSTELLAIQPMEIFVKRRKGGFPIPQEDYHLIGTWEARSLNVISEDEDDDEYEYYEVDEDDDNGEEDEDDEYEYEYYEDDEEEEEEVDEKQEATPK